MFCISFLRFLFRFRGSGYRGFFGVGVLSDEVIKMRRGRVEGFGYVFKLNKKENEEERRVDGLV